MKSDASRNPTLSTGSELEWRAQRSLDRRFSWTLFWYVLRQYLVPLVCCLLGFCILFLIMDVFDDLEDFLEANSPAGGIAVYFLARQPVNIVHVLPMSVLLAVSFTMNMMGRHREITALRSAGVSIVQSCMPMWVIAIAMAGLLFWLNEAVGPQFVARSEILRDRLLGDQSEVLQRERLAFRNSASNRTWFFETFNRHGTHRGVSVKQFDASSNRLQWELRARTGAFRNGHWVFHDVTRWEYDPGDRLPVRQRTYQTFVADALTERPGKIFSSLRPAEELSAFEMLTILREQKNLPASTRNVFRTVVWYRLTFPLSCIIASLFGVGTAVGRHGASALRGFAAAVGILVLYHVLSQVFVLLGKYGLVPPVGAGLIPPLGFVLWGACKVYRGR